MKRIANNTALHLLLGSTMAFAACVAPAPLEFREIAPELSDAGLFNPGMGLCLAGGSKLGYQPPPDAWVLKLADIVYFRPTWDDLEAGGAGVGFEAYFKPIFDFWVKERGKRVAFRVMSESTHHPGQYATPKWVFDQGAHHHRHRRHVAAHERDADAANGRQCQRHDLSG